MKKKVKRTAWTKLKEELANAKFHESLQREECNRLMNEQKNNRQVSTQDIYNTRQQIINIWVQSIADFLLRI